MSAMPGAGLTKSASSSMTPVTTCTPMEKRSDECKMEVIGNKSNTNFNVYDLFILFFICVSPDFGHQFCSGVAFGADVLHDGGGLLRGAALGQCLAQEGQRDCGRLFHVDSEPEGAVL